MLVVCGTNGRPASGDMRPLRSTGTQLAEKLSRKSSTVVRVAPHTSGTSSGLPAFNLKITHENTLFIVATWLPAAPICPPPLSFPFLPPWLRLRSLRFTAACPHGAGSHGGWGVRVQDLGKGVRGSDRGDQVGVHGGSLVRGAVAAAVPGGGACLRQVRERKTLPQPPPPPHVFRSVEHLFRPLRPFLLLVYPLALDLWGTPASAIHHVF